MCFALQKIERFCLRGGGMGVGGWGLGGSGSKHRKWIWDMYSIVLNNIKGELALKFLLPKKSSMKCVLCHCMLIPAIKVKGIQEHDGSETGN